MHQRSIAAAVTIFVLIIIGMFIFAYLKRAEISREPILPTIETPAQNPYAYIDRIDAKHFYIDGTHTLVGELMLRTPCELLDWDARVQESMPETIAINFKILSEDAEQCAQVLTPARFRVDAMASREATIRTYLNGVEVPLNLIPATPGETPDEFEIFIKG